MSRRKGLSLSAGKTIIGDRRLLPRIREYLSEMGVERVDTTHLCDHLQESYSEYSRRKKQPFRNLVQKACALLSRDPEERLVRLERAHMRKRRLPIDDRTPESQTDESRDASDADVDEPLVTVKNSNMLNGSLVAVYKSEATVSATPSDKVDGNELPSEDLAQQQNEPSTMESVGRKRKRTKGESNRAEKRVKQGASFHDFSLTQPTATFADIGGKKACLEEVSKLLLHLLHPEVYRHLGITPPRGFLLHGPPGSGKTLLANAIAGELNLPFVRVAATELVSGVSGESEEKIRQLFKYAKENAPCILFLDEIDAITPKRENASKDMERRIVSQLLTCMDELDEFGLLNERGHVFVIGATNRLDSIDPALRRAGRFDREISLGIPNVKERESILRVLCRPLHLSSDFDFEGLAKQSPGFVGADLVALLREASTAAVNRVFASLGEKEDCTAVKEDKKNLLAWLKDTRPLSEDDLQRLFVTIEDFEVALPLVQPSAKREGFATVPDVTWADVGALDEIRKELTVAILAPVRHPERFSALGLTSSAGVLLAGPPGCGKTLLAKAIANESGINFISVKGPELLNMYVGESERAVRQVFERARNSAPCVIFFDEVDALCPRRSYGGDTNVSARVVNQMLTEMDGLSSRKQVFVMAATNRPDIIDTALLRPGRLDRTLYVGVPSAVDRFAILRTLTKNGSRPALHSDVCLKDVAEDERCSNFSGADLAALVREASLGALLVEGTVEDSKDIPLVEKRHFEEAFLKVKPSITEKERQYFSVNNKK
ncbi:nuclear valosin-containing protein-like [Oscarella lobularis]|uniref:nuclear valosin-containing protein-like n=1 Tax=Oscarella lobularis TaxID=121494 RepID=UPI0033136BE1